MKDLLKSQKFPIISLPRSHFNLEKTQAFDSTSSMLTFFEYRDDDLQRLLNVRLAIDQF